MSARKDHKYWDYAPPAPYDQHFIDPSYSGRARGTFRYLRRFIPRNRLVSPSDLRRIEDLYDGEILWTDYQIGRLFGYLKEMDLWEDTLLAVTSDHGEEFQEHNSFHHIRTIYEEVLRVPLIIKPPGDRPREWREAVTERVGQIDLATTLLHLSGVDIPDTFEGHMRESRSSLASSNLPVVLTEEQTEHLRTLGYVQ